MTANKDTLHSRNFRLTNTRRCTEHVQHLVVEEDSRSHIFISLQIIKRMETRFFIRGQLTFDFSSSKKLKFCLHLNLTNVKREFDHRHCASREFSFLQLVTAAYFSFLRLNTFWKINKINILFYRNHAF